MNWQKVIKSLRAQALESASEAAGAVAKRNLTTAEHHAHNALTLACLADALEAGLEDSDD